MSTSAASSASIASSTSAFGELAPFVRKDASETLAKLLADNHAKHHCFFNTRGMHNHSAHQLIADLTLSATPAQLDAHYQYQIQHYLGEFNLNDRASYDPYVSASTDGGKGQKVEKIDELNWTKHLGNARYYWSYLHFFDSQLKQSPFDEVLHKYVFSTDANTDATQMVVRFYGGVLHPLIHFGYGLELNSPALAAEGLAMATSTAASHSWLLDYHWLTSAPSTGDKRGLLELIKEMQADPRLSVQELKLNEQESALPDEPFEQPGSAGYGVIQSYVDRWSAIQSSTQANEEQAMGELSLFSTLLLGAVPTQPSGAYKHDFFLMHLNNAHLFTPLYLSLFSSTSRPCADPHVGVVFLRALLAQFFYYYIARGRPSFSGQSYHAELAHSPPFDWDQLFAESRQNVDEHLPKAVRALYVYHTRHSHLYPLLIHSNLLNPSPPPLDSVSNKNHQQSIWSLTAQQLVRMHQGQLQKSKYAGTTANDKDEPIGAHQEFWSFDPFF